MPLRSIQATDPRFTLCRTVGRGNYNDADRECSTEEYSQDRGVISVLYNANYAIGRSAVMMMMRPPPPTITLAERTVMRVSLLL